MQKMMPLLFSVTRSSWGVVQVVFPGKNILKTNQRWTADQRSRNQLLKRTIVEQNGKLDQLEQHGRRDSLRISGIPEVQESDDTDAAVITLCAAIKVYPPVQPEDIAVSHRVGKAAEGKPRPVLVKFATCNIRERVFRAKKTSKLNERKMNRWNIYKLRERVLSIFDRG